MPLATVLLYLVVVYVRPGEIIPGWEGFPFAAICEVVAAIAVGLSLLMRPRRFLNQPHDRYVAGFFAAVVLSNAAWGWFGGAWIAFQSMGPTMLCYVLLRGAVRSARHLRWVGYTLVALTLFQAVNGISQFQTGVGLGHVSALEQSSGDERGDGESSEVRRIQGAGIFNDPNDLAMALVAVLPFLLGPMLARRSRLPVRALTLALLVPIIVALFYTNSRGGVLGLGAVLAAHALRLGKAAGTVVAVLGLAALLALGPSRLGQLSSEEGSAQGRVQSWSAGLQMLKSRPVLGVGFGRYTEFNDLVAHNSLVHTLAEAGMVGGFFFTGMFYWAFLGARRTFPSPPPDPELDRIRNWGQNLRNGTLGLLACAMFLSRQYAIVTFIWVALSACYRQVLQEAGAALTPTKALDTASIGAATMGGVVAVYVAVRVLAIWSG